MRVTTRVVFDIETWAELERESLSYDGPISLCKRGEAKGIAQGQISLGDQMAQMLTNLQKSYTDPAANTYQSLLKSPYGFLPQQLSSLLGGARDQTTGLFSSALNQLKQQMTARGEGGQVPLSGPAASQYGQFGAAEAGAVSSAQRDVQIQNAAQQIQNMFGAATGLGNLASVYNPSPYTSLASGGLGARTELETAPTIGGNIMTSWLSNPLGRK